MSKKSELQANIDKLEAGMKSPALPANFLPKLEEKLAKMKKELADLPAEKKVTFKTTSEKYQEKKKEVTAAAKAKKKAAQPVKKNGGARKGAGRKKTTVGDDDSITIQGITITQKGCPDGYEAFKEYRKSKKKSAEKSDAKPDSQKSVVSVKHGIEHIIDSISQSTIDKDPKGVKKALESFRSHMDQAFKALSNVLSKTQVEELKKALGSIDKILKEISSTK